MNKTDLIEHISRQADISKAAAGRALDAVMGGVEEALARSESVNLSGFGTFSVSQRQERQGRHPRTGEPIRIAGGRVPKFKPGQALREALNAH